MLALERDVGEILTFHVPGVPEPIVVKVVRVSWKKVRLGIACNKNIQILRDDARKKRKV